MRKIILLSLLAITAFVANAQSYIYNGRSTGYYDVLYTFDGKYIYKGRSTGYYDVLYTVSGDHVYTGRNTGYYDTLYTTSGHWPIAALLTVLQ